MNNFIGCWFHILIVSILLIHQSYTDCPNQKLFSPCNCESVNDVDTGQTVERHVVCSGNSSMDIKAVFKTLTKSLPLTDRHFTSLDIRGVKIWTIEYDTTDKITFEKISIGSMSLEKIHSKSFVNTAHKVKSFKLSPRTISLKSAQGKYDWFSLFNSFHNLKELRIYTPNLASIPSDAFKKLTKLETLVIKTNEVNDVPAYPFMYNQLSISDNAFYSLKSLTGLYIQENDFGFVSSKTFNFKDKNSKTLTIYMPLNDLKDTSFELGAFVNLKRPTHLKLLLNPLTILKEAIFKPFLDANRNNLIYTIHIHCEDPGNAWWLQSKGNYYYRVIDDECGIGYEPNDFDFEPEKEAHGKTEEDYQA